MLIGALAFIVVTLALAAPGNQVNSWSVSQASAGEVIASRALEVTAPAGPAAENAVVAAAGLRPAPDPLLPRRLMEMALLGFGFSLLFAMNMGLFRHLRRVQASSRPQRDRLN